jgi:hypothetical protein
MEGQRYRHSNPTQDIIGPGSTGSIAPAIPVKQKINPVISKKMSIVNKLEQKNEFIFISRRQIALN